MPIPGIGEEEVAVVQVTIEWESSLGTGGAWEVFMTIATYTQAGKYAEGSNQGQVWDKYLTVKEGFQRVLYIP